MSLKTFLTKNARWLGAGALMTAGSSFGQTYFISLYAGHIRAEFDLSHGEWGGIYTVGTFLSAALMLWAGTLADRMTIRRLAPLILAGLASVCVVMALNRSALLLIPIVFGLRFCGQGMLSHLPMVAAGRWFARNRGRAVSIISLGFSAAEAIFPILFVALMAVTGWRVSWVIAALLALLVIVPLRILLREERQPKGVVEETAATGMADRHWTRAEAMSHWLFWLVLPAFMFMPVFGTAMFFQQVHLSESKGWALAEFVAFIPLLSLVTVISLLAGGWLIDRFGAGRLVPIFLLPFAAGFVVMSSGTSLSTVPAAFVLMGMSSGLYGALSGTFWPEHYGTAHLGAIRAVATSVMVFSSALGPGLTGWLIDLGIAFQDQMLWYAALGLAVTALASIGAILARPLLPVQA